MNMAADRRQSDARRDGGSSGDRRQKSDRRAAPGRREIDQSGGKAKASSEAGAGKAAKTKKGAAKVSAVLRKLVIFFIICVGLFSVGLIYFFANLDSFMGEVGKRVKVTIDRAFLDPDSLTDRTTRARLNFRVKNSLPMGVILQNMNFSLNISEYPIAKGMQASPKLAIDGGHEAIVPVACNVDSIMTRRALQKTIEKNAGPLLKGLLNRAQGKADTFGDDIKALVKVTGTAEFRLKAGGVEIPFTRQLNF